MKPDPQKLKAAREKHGWSQPYAAGLLGINWRTLLRWERGQSVKSPTAADLQAMASVYGVGVAELCEVANG